MPNQVHVDMAEPAGGMGMCCGKTRTCRVTLDLWQVMQSRTQVVQFLRIRATRILLEASGVWPGYPGGPAHEQIQKPVFAYILVLEA